MNKKFIFMALIVGFIFQFNITLPADGSLDTSFGGNSSDAPGIVTTYIGNAAEASSISLQADGKIIVAGYATDGGNNKIALARYNTSGSLDINFGTGGIVTTSISNNAKANSVSIQSDGKIIIAGYAGTGSSFKIALARYNIDGSLDPSFGTGGIVTTSIGSSNAKANSISIQKADGKIIIGGYIGNDLALARYNIDGSLDTSFGTGGIVTTVFTGFTYTTAKSIAIQDDSKIIAVGFSGLGGTNPAQFILARYNANGTLDSGFGSNNNGKIVVPMIGAYDQARSVAIQANGKIVVAGFVNYTSAGLRFALIRYDINGVQDNTFGNNGIVTTLFYDANHNVIDMGIQSLAIQADGKIIAAGYTDVSDKFALVRYSINGIPDSTFGNNGIVTTSIGNRAQSNSVAIQIDGKIIVAGYAGPTTSSYALMRSPSNLARTYRFALARYNNGSNSIFTSCQAFINSLHQKYSKIV